MVVLIAITIIIVVIATDNIPEFSNNPHFGMLPHLYPVACLPCPCLFCFIHEQDEKKRGYDVERLKLVGRSGAWKENNVYIFINFSFLRTNICISGIWVISKTLYSDNDTFQHMRRWLVETNALQHMIKSIDGRWHIGSPILWSMIIYYMVNIVNRFSHLSYRTGGLGNSKQWGIYSF